MDTGSSKHLSSLSDLQVLPDLQKLGPTNAALDQAPRDMLKVSPQHATATAEVEAVAQVNNESLCDKSEENALLVDCEKCDLENLVCLVEQVKWMEEHRFPLAPPLPKFAAATEGDIESSHLPCEVTNGSSWQKQEQRMETETIRRTVELIDCNQWESAAATERDAKASSSQESFSKLSAADATGDAWRDPALLRFSDPEVLSTMMADVQLLGAHVDHLIGMQQKLLGKATASNGETEAPRGSPPHHAHGSTYSASFVAGENCDWPSQPYDPSRYGMYDTDCQDRNHVEEEDTQLDHGSHTHRIDDGKWDLSSGAAELHTAIDSLERRSMVFQQRIRNCAVQLEVRQREG